MKVEATHKDCSEDCIATSGKALAGVVAMVVAAASLTGCQNMGSNAGSNATVGAIVGCIGGAAMASGNHRGTACAAGAAVGGAVGYYVGRQKDLELARKVSRQIEQSQSPDVARVSVKAKPVSVPEGERAQVGGAKTVEALDSMVVSVPHALVDSRDKAAASTFGQVGGYVSNASGSSKVLVSARSQKDFDYIVSSIRGGYAHDVGSKVGYEFRPLARGTQASVEVVPV